MAEHELSPASTSPLARHWRINSEKAFLNHGSFGAAPIPVLERQRDWIDLIERQPVRFYARRLEQALDDVRVALGEFVGADPDDLALVTNATEGVNTVLRSLALEPGDELIVTSQEYNASANALRFVADRAGAKVVLVDVPFPLSGPEEVVERVLAAVTERTKLLLIDHVTSQTGLRLPVEQIVPALRERGVETLIDGAHAPGMVRLDLDKLGAAYYTGNCHKWLCTPKGSALLHVRRDLQAGIRPLSISHGANSARSDRPLFRLEFDWQGTGDPSAWLVIPDALRFLRGLYQGGFEQLRASNRKLVVDGRRELCRRLEIEPPAPESMLESLASIPLPDRRKEEPLIGPYGLDPLHVALHGESVEVPVMPWPKAPARLLRISGQAYNSPSQYVYLADKVAELLAARPRARA